MTWLSYGNLLSCSALSAQLRHIPPVCVDNTLLTNASLHGILQQCLISPVIAVKGTAMNRSAILLLPAIFMTAAVCLGCGRIEGPQFPWVASPLVTVSTPSSPASGDIPIIYKLIDRELEKATITLEYSTDGGQTYNTATLTVPAEATNLASAWHPGKSHTVQWDSVTDMVGRSGAVEVKVRITPSDASNPSGTAGVSDTFTVDNTAYNEAPTATTAAPAGVQSGNVQINYFLSDVESDTCSIEVLYSVNNGTTWQSATMGTAGDGLTGLSSSPAGTAHVYFWDSRADNVALSGQVDTVKIRVIPTDFNTGTAGDTNSFSVDNSTPNVPPTVTITSGPADSSTVYTTQVTFTWSGSDTDGSVTGYYYSFDHDPPDVWTTDTTVTSSPLSEGEHTFRVVAMDDESDLSAVASRTFTVSILGTITADFIGTPLTGEAPLTVDFTDLSTATNGIDTWSWTFGDGGTSSQQNPSYEYASEGTYTVSLTVTGPDGSDNETKTNYVTVTGGPAGDTIYVDDSGGLDSNDGLSWATAVKTIQTGLDKASDNWTVFVANGIYTGTTNKNLDFTGKAIHLKSVGGAANCIIDCKLDGRGFYFDNGETTAAEVDGFTIQNGQVSMGGGILCLDSDCTVANCRIVNNNVPGYDGGGIRCENSDIKVLNCTITNNSAFRDGGGIHCYVNCSLEITNSLIANNSAGWGGGIRFSEGILTASNCTIVNNIAANYGGGLSSTNVSDSTLNNVVLWGNTAAYDGNQISTGGNVVLNYCDYANGTGDIQSTGSVTDPLGSCVHLDPLFVNATAQDYRLQSGSACIDAGDNSLVPPGVTTDLDGNKRIYDGDGDATATVDIGAYEYGSSPPAVEYGWTHVAGGEKYDKASAVCADGNGNVYVVGHFAYLATNLTVNFAADWGMTDEKTSKGERDCFIMKVSSDGSYCWTRRIGGSSADSAYSVCVDAENSVYVAGSVKSWINFAEDWGGDDFKTAEGGFVTKIGADGAYCWTHIVGEHVSSICATSSSIHLAGVFEDTVNFAADWGGTDEKTSTGDKCDVFVTKITTDGDYCWTHIIGGEERDYPCGLYANTAGQVFLAGEMGNGSAAGYTVNFAADWSGSDEKTSAGLGDIFITSMSPTGGYGWTHVMGGAEIDRPEDVVGDGSGNLYVTGHFGHIKGSNYSVNFAADWGGTDSKTSAGDADIFLTKIRQSGEYLHSHVIGGENCDEAHGIAVDTSGNVYIVGHFSAPVNFASDWGGTDDKSIPWRSYDIFLTKISGIDDYGWTYCFGGSNPDYTNGISVDAAGNLYFCGGFSGTDINFAEEWGGDDTKTSFDEEDIYITKISIP